MTSPGQTPAEVEEMVLRRRKQLLGDGPDDGLQSIVWSLQRDDTPLEAVPSRSTVWQILFRRGAITQQPQRRPKSATRWCCFARPNECWQSDWTQWALADDTEVTVAGTLDHHSRYVVGLSAGPVHADGDLVRSAILAAVAACTMASMSLSGNGIVYTDRFHDHKSALVVNLRALGVRTINLAPFYPQTCGKVERFWPTLKGWLRSATTPRELIAPAEPKPAPQVSAMSGDIRVSDVPSQHRR